MNAKQGLIKYGGESNWVILKDLGQLQDTKALLPVEKKQHNI